jgi:hypothetical protein
MSADISTTNPVRIPELRLRSAVLIAVLLNRLSWQGFLTGLEELID